MSDAPILQQTIPAEVLEAAQEPLPRMRPFVGGWPRFDEAYAAQMALKRKLIDTRREAVIGLLDGSLDVARECLAETMNLLSGGAGMAAATVTCPDGVEVTLDRDDPLATLGRFLQQDICILEKRGAEHVLTGAVLCFPASWTLAEKLGQPMTAIHGPVAPYDANIAKRVQRLFDGIKVDQPMWRANLLRYEDPALFQPRSEADPRPTGDAAAPYLRSEHQTLFRLPESGAIVFAIHTVVVRADQ